MSTIFEGLVITLSLLLRLGIIPRAHLSRRYVCILKCFEVLIWALSLLDVFSMVVTENLTCPSDLVLVIFECSGRVLTTPEPGLLFFLNDERSLVSLVIMVIFLYGMLLHSLIEFNLVCVLLFFNKHIILLLTLAIEFFIFQSQILFCSLYIRRSLLLKQEVGKLVHCV